MFEEFLKLGKLECKNNLRKKYTLNDDRRLWKKKKKKKIVLYSPVGYMMDWEISLDHRNCFLSLPSFTTFVPLSSHAIKVNCLLLILLPLSLVNHYKTVRARDLQLWHNIHHTPCVICPLSHVRCHMSQIGEVSPWRVSYQRGHPI